MQNRVDVIEFHDVHVHSATSSFKLPSVIRLRQYIRPFFLIKDNPSRQQVFKRDQQTCQYCRERFSLKELTIDHVIPLSKGGNHSWENVVAACGKCNNRKGSKSLKQMGYQLRSRPTKPKSLLGRRLGPYPDGIPLEWLPFLPHLKEEFGA